MSRDELSNGEIKVEKKIEYCILQRGVLDIEMKFCCNLSLDEMRKRKQEVESLLPDTGLYGGWSWKVMIDSDIQDFAPVKCEERDGYWHYIACS